MKWFFALYIKIIRLEYFHQILILKMQLQDFEHIKLRGGMKNCFCYSFFFKENTYHLKEATGSCSVKKVFQDVFLPRNLRCSG